MTCGNCEVQCVKNGFQSGKQRYRCKECGRSFQRDYVYKAYQPKVNGWIVDLVKEGCGIRSISRLLQISSTTTINRILRISEQIKPPSIPIGKSFQLDELCTYIGNKNRRRWIAYAIENTTKQVVSLVVGSRTLNNLSKVVNSLLLAHPKKIHTDKLNIYRSLIPSEIHKTKQYAINHIERMNLSLRTHLKRLNRKTICYTKSITMLVACLKIYFWSGSASAK